MLIASSEAVLDSKVIGTRSSDLMIPPSVLNTRVAKVLYSPSGQKNCTTLSSLPYSRSVIGMHESLLRYTPP